MSAVLKRKFEEEDLYPVQLEDAPMAETQVHVNQIIYIVVSLDNFFLNTPDLYVAGDMTFYYEEANPKKFIVPDVFVVKGISKKIRRVFKLWEEQPPIVVFEISSRKTWGIDLNQKWKLYEQIGVKEYYIFDPEYDYLPEPLVAYKLSKKGELRKVAVKNGRIFSENLGLDLVCTDDGLRFFDPQKSEFLRTLIESENALTKTENALTKTENALKQTKTALELEQQARSEAENEIEKLKSEIAALKNPSA